MKRKRGKRGHKKEKKETEPANTQSTSESEPEPEPEPKVSKIESEREAEPERKNEPERKTEPAPPPKAVYSRVKVKIKSPALEPPQSSSEKSNKTIQLEREKEERESSLSDVHTPKLINTFSRKLGSIKIKSSATTVSSTNSSKGNLVNSSEVTEGKKEVSINLPHDDLSYNEKELISALHVIKKIMKMDAAAPFNEPVDPVALDIPDYFDVIDTPMDFSTICKNIEKIRKYVNSEGVYRDVQLIWHNCYKYNNKGDYIIDLMKRVKKNFNKYWTAAGLYSDSTGNSENMQTEETHSKGKSSKNNSKKKKRSTLDHKSDCLCAVCVVRRRRKEKEEDGIVNLEEKSPITNPLSDTEENNKKELKLEETGSAPGDNINSSYVNSGNNNNNNNTQASQVLSSETSDEEQEMEYKEKENEALENINITSNNDDNDLDSEKNGGLADGSNQEEAYNKADGTIKMNEILMENHSVLPLCKSIFTNKYGSVWSGPHSLARPRPSPVRVSPIHAAISSLMKQ